MGLFPRFPNGFFFGLTKKSRMVKYEEGDLVWAKIGRYPWWPSVLYFNFDHLKIVVPESEVAPDVLKAKRKNSTLVRFFADTQLYVLKSACG